MFMYNFRRNSRKILRYQRENICMRVYVYMFVHLLCYSVLAHRWRLRQCERLQSRLNEPGDELLGDHWGKIEQNATVAG